MKEISRQTPEVFLIARLILSLLILRLEKKLRGWVRTPKNSSRVLLLTTKELGIIFSIRWLHTQLESFGNILSLRSSSAFRFTKHSLTLLDWLVSRWMLRLLY